MIDVESIREEQTWKRVALELLVNLVPLFLTVYGLKMLATQHGQMLQSVRGETYHHLHLVAISGSLAAITGAHYLALGLFIYMSDGRPPAESRGGFWRLSRGSFRWGNLAAAFFCFFEMEKMTAERPWASAALPGHLLLKMVGSITGIMISLFFLLAMYQREEIKRELDSRGCEPIHILWRPAAYWLGRYLFGWWRPTGFRVIYSDPAGAIHQGYCFVYQSFQQNRQFGNRRVKWVTDEVTAQRPAPEVWVDPEILRAKLGFGEASAQRDAQAAEPNAPEA